jgi:hypothetical protein
MATHLKHISDKLIQEIDDGRVLRIVGLAIGPAQGLSVVGRYENRALIINMYAYNELHIKLDCASTFMFRIMPNTLLFRLNIFLAPRLLTYDKDLDQSYLIRTYYKNQLTPLFSQTSIHDIIKDLIPFNTVHFRNGLLRYGAPCDFAHHTSTDVLARVKILNRLAIALEALS